MSASRLRSVLELVANGRLSVQEAEACFAHLPFEDLGFARVDHHRAVRGLGPEVIYARSKTPEQVAAVATALMRREGAPVLATKANEAHARAVLAGHPEAIWHAPSGMIVLRRLRQELSGTVMVLCAGTSDLPIAEEASVTAEAFGCRVELIADVGVAGPHRLFAEVERVQRAAVLIVVAGMEGALPSLAAGLYGGPVIAVPTSVGYGAAFEGLAALLGMLNSCAVGVSVVNIDNGFGAGVIAARILSHPGTGRRDAAGATQRATGRGQHPGGSADDGAPGVSGLS
jgi:pyridinium-3,5-biscarboxylic acid mononucleotide synthase